MGPYLTVGTSPADARLTVRNQISGALIWFILSIGFQLFFGEIIEALTPFLAAPLMLLLMAIGVIIGAAGLWSAWEIRDRGKAALFTAAALPLLWLLLPAAQSALLHLRFLVERPHYDRIVQQLRRMPVVTQEWQRAHLENVRIDPGPPLRIAFVTWRSIPDPWGAIVHDPSGALKAAQGGDRTRLRIFNSSVRHCGHVTGDYYRCSFS